MTTLLAPATAPARTDRTTPVPQQAVPAGVAGPAPARQAPPPRRLVLSGTLTQADRDELEPRLAALVRGGAPTVEVDLSRVRTMDAAVARLLLRTSWRLGDPERTLLLLHPNRQVRGVLRFVGAGDLVVR